MQTHRDNEHSRLTPREFGRVLPTPKPDTVEDKIDRLRKRAATIKGGNEITAGAPDEIPIYVGESCGTFVCRRPDDPDCLRISIGMVPGAPDTSYLIFRGDPPAIRALLERAVAALRSSPAVAGERNGDSLPGFRPGAIPGEQLGRG